MRDRILYSICLGFISGVLVRSLFFVNIYFLILLSILSFGLFFFSYFSQLKWGIITFLFLGAFSLGIFRFHVVDTIPPSVSEGTLQGIIVDEPDIRENNQKLTIKIENRVKILATVDKYGEFEYGDEVEIKGKAE